MPLPFLKPDAERELGLRIAHACESEQKEHKRASAELGAECSRRGVTGTSVYTSRFMSMEFDHLQRLASIVRDEVFGIVEADGLRLAKSDIAAISDLIKRTLEPLLVKLEGDIRRQNVGLALRESMSRALTTKALSLMHREAVEEVEIRAGALRRKHDVEHKRRWRKRAERLAWILVGVLATLATQWLTRWLR